MLQQAPDDPLLVEVAYLGGPHALSIYLNNHEEYRVLHVGSAT